MLEDRLDYRHFFARPDDIGRRPVAEQQPDGALTVSIGVVNFPDDGANAQEILRRVDRALYEAKRAGKNRSVNYTKAAA